MCKYSDVFSLAVLIGRGLDLNVKLCVQAIVRVQILFPVFSFQGICLEL